MWLSQASRLIKCVHYAFGTVSLEFMPTLTCKYVDGWKKYDQDYSIHLLRTYNFDIHFNGNQLNNAENLLYGMIEVNAFDDRSIRIDEKNGKWIFVGRMNDFGR